MAILLTRLEPVHPICSDHTVRRLSYASCLICQDQGDTLPCQVTLRTLHLHKWSPDDRRFVDWVKYSYVVNYENVIEFTSCQHSTYVKDLSNSWVKKHGHIPYNYCYNNLWQNILVTSKIEFVYHEYLKTRSEIVVFYHKFATPKFASNLLTREIQICGIRTHYS